MKRYDILIFGILVLTLQACASTPPLEARHQVSGLNTQFNGAQLTFAEYVARSRDMIAKTHTAANPAELDKIIEGNAPFELKPPASCPSGKSKPYRRGVLLTHGLTDSPYFMRYLASLFQENCFRVMVILLPGHGTQPGDLLEVRWEEWAKAEAYGTDKLAAEVDEVYLAGFSTGGALSVYQSQNDKRVRGLFLFSPALKVSSLASLANMHVIYSWAIPSAKWLDIMPDKDIYKYESFPKNAAAEIYALSKLVNGRLQTQPLSIPIFVAASQDDTTVFTSATVDLMARATHPASRMIFYSADVTKPPQFVPPEKLTMMYSVFPEQRILSSAHTAILLPPEDIHYGLSGDYSNCLHYYPKKFGKEIEKDMEKYVACTTKPQEDLQGELTEVNLKAGIMRRLMYNPNFAGLKRSLKIYIDGLM
jgi:esterase/lipase